MTDKSNLQLYFKEFIKPASLSDGPVSLTDHVCDLLVYEPRNIEEAQLGTLFMLGKIENIPKNKYKSFDFLLNLLISVIKREFYSDPKRIPLEALEASLNKANLYLADFTEKGNVEWIGNLNFICGTFYGNALHITQTGKLIIKLLRGTTINHIENKFPAQKKPYPLKTFGNIASGTILNGDKIILGTKDILNATSLTRFKKFSKENCDQIVEGIKEFTENKPSKTPIICLVLEAKTRKTPEEKVAYVPIRKVESSKILKSTKIKTTVLKTLRISRKISIIIFLVIYRTIRFLIFILKKIYKILAPFLRKISKTSFYKLLLPLFLKIRNLSIKLAEQIRIKQKCHNFKKQLMDFKNYKVTAFYQQNKPAFFVASFLILLVLILPFAAVQKINYNLKINRFNELSAGIQAAQKKTDAALIYQEKEKAKGLIQKNQTLVANLLEYLEKSPLKNNDEIIEKATQIQKKHQEQMDSISNVIRIKNLEEIIDFSTSGFIVNPVGINKIGENLYFYELDSGILYKFHLGAEEKPLTLVFISAKDELRKMVSLKNGQMVLFGQGGKAYLYNSNTNDHSSYSLDPVISVENIKDVKSFFSNFYILNTDGNIIKYSNELKGNNWLSEQLKDAQSIAIDGSIYVLDTNGLIIKYFRGKKVEEIQPKLEKTLEGENKIFTGDDFKNLYISDPKNRRLIILNKRGEIINQYANSNFANLKDFWVTKNEKEVYLLCGKKVFKLEL